jgi:hypothetical protein
MTRVFIMVLLLLAACAPEPENLTVPVSARPFARITIPTDVNKTLIGLRNALESGDSSFVVVGGLDKQMGFRTFWVAVAGQTANVFFKIEAAEENSVIRVLTEPSPPPEPQRLARDLDIIGNLVRVTLELPSYKLEPDR